MTKENGRSTDIANLNVKRILLQKEVMILKMPALRDREGSMIVPRVQSMMTILIQMTEGANLILRMKRIVIEA